MRADRHVRAARFPRGKRACTQSPAKVRSTFAGYYNRPSRSMFEIGNSLREARLRQGLDFPPVEQATKIRGKWLRALEEEQFDVLPAQTYVKGFLRSYADYLGLDGQLYVDEFNSRYVRGEIEEEEERPLQPRIAGGQRGGACQNKAVMLTVAAI